MTQFARGEEARSSDRAFSFDPASRKILNYAARAGVDDPTALSWLGMFPMCMGVQPFGSAYRGDIRRDGAELWAASR